MKTTILLLVVSCVHLLAQTNTNNFEMSFEATGQLMNALQYGGSDNAIKLLLEKGANVNAKNNDGWCPLQLAAKRGDLGIVRLLLENGADVNAKDSDGGTALISAAKRGYVEIIKLLLEKGADIDAKIENVGTALAFAAWAGQTNAVAFLLDKGSDINATNGRCNLVSVICFSSIRLRPSGVKRSEGERSEPSAAEPRRGEAAPRAINWSRAGHAGFLLGCSQTHPTPNPT
jgi:hypothetical protein